MIDNTVLTTVLPIVCKSIIRLITLLLLWIFQNHSCQHCSQAAHLLHYQMSAKFKRWFILVKQSIFVGKAVCSPVLTLILITFSIAPARAVWKVMKVSETNDEDAATSPWGRTEGISVFKYLAGAWLGRKGNCSFVFMESSLGKLSFSQGLRSSKHRLNFYVDFPIQWNIFVLFSQFRG